MKSAAARTVLVIVVFLAIYIPLAVALLNAHLWWVTLAILLVVVFTIGPLARRFIRGAPASRR